MGEQLCLKEEMKGSPDWMSNSFQIYFLQGLCRGRAKADPEGRE